MSKVYIDNVLRIQEKYGWMMNSYVLDFYTKHLWKHLPPKWTDVLSGLNPEEIAFFLLEMYAPVQKPKTCTFRKVWPLELLAFLAACHSLNLQYCQKQNDTDDHGVQEMQHVAVVNNTPHCKSHTSCSRQCEQNCTATDRRTQPSQNARLEHNFRYNVKNKKQHEIDVLSKVICDQAEALNCQHIVDVGSGVGHLSRLLSKNYKLNVVAVEQDGSHTPKAEKLDSNLHRRLKKQQERFKANTSDSRAQGSLIHFNRHINAGISAKEFMKEIWERFNDDKNYKTKADMNVIIVGLHTCGDLAATLLRMFSDCENIVGCVFVGCCYMRLTAESSDSSSSMAKTHGYPMSHYLTSSPSHRQDYNALEAACHALGRYHKKLLENCPTLKLHHYRALLEMLFQEQDPNGQRKQIRKLDAKKAAKMTFKEYVTSACEILKEDCPSSEDICRVHEEHEGKENHVVIFYVLRLLLAPLVEGLILQDRLLFLKENHPNIKARISLLFDPDLSPRNMVIIASKTSLERKV